MPQLLLLVIVLIALATFAAMAIALIVSALFFLFMACAIGIPLWLLYQRWSGKPVLGRSRQTAVDRLKNLYVEGKIDLFEFERRVAHLIAAERT